MEIRKITHGTVIQLFNLETGKLLDSIFIAADTEPYEDEQGNIITDGDIIEKANQLDYPIVTIG